jgi:O-antigen ligase
LFVGVVVLSLIDSAFGISQSIVKSLGRNTTYTGRTEIWREVKEQPINPLIGCGFLTFWDTKMGSDAIDGIGARINTAHNGYLEIYLDGGILGLTLLGIMVLAGGMKVTERLLGGTLWGRMSFAIWICALVYNNSESDFFRFSPLWFTLLLVIIERPQPPPCAEHQVNSPDEYIMCSSQDTKPVPA